MKQLFFLFLFMCIGNFLWGQSWKAYPYHKQGSLIYFPEDEGAHPAESSEWWYTVAHVTGDSTGNEYTYMLSYFRSPQFGFDGFRIFNLSNETEKLFFPETLPCNYPVLSQDSLNIQALPLGTPLEQWRNLLDSTGNKLPFQYHLYAHQQHGFIQVNYNAVKPPLIIADSGLLYEGSDSYTYYYSQTGIDVSGTISVNGTTEPVSGSAWIDRQYGAFNSNGDERYEWFCIQLSNGMDINVWNIFNLNNEIPDSSANRICCIYYNDTTSATFSDFTLQRLTYTYMPDSLRCYSQKWHLLFQDIDLTITTVDSRSEVPLPFRFFEGSTKIDGTVSGQRVTGVGFAELTHSYEKPQVQFINPDTVSVWNASQPIIWKILNPDDGDPVCYALSYSIDGGSHFNPIVDRLTDTLYDWDYSGLSDSTNCIFKVTAYSIDSTLVGETQSDSVLLINTGVKDYPENSLVTIYPNPSLGLFTIEGKAIQSIEVTNMKGQLVYGKKNSNNQRKTTVDISNRPKGIYLVTVVTQSAKVSKKVTFY